VSDRCGRHEISVSLPLRVDGCVSYIFIYTLNLTLPASACLVLLYHNASAITTTRIQQSQEPLPSSFFPYVQKTILSFSL